MQPSLFDDRFSIADIPEAEVVDAVASGALLLTATVQLAADWKARIVEAAIVSSANCVVPTPQVFVWSHWLAAEARGCEAMPVSCNALQEMQLWQRLIMVKQGCDRGTAQGLAEHAVNAYALMREYRISEDQLHGFGEESDALLHWIATMQQELHGHKRILQADMAERLLPLIDHAPKTVLLAGFATVTPMQQCVLKALIRNGSSVAVITAPEPEALPTLSCCVDEVTEYRHVAASVAADLAAAPDSRIAIVTSTSIKDGEKLRRLLNDALLSAVPDRVAAASLQLQAVNMAGPQLATLPMVRQLIGLLQLAGKSGAPFSEFSRLLLAPGSKGFDDERLDRAALDVELREKKRHFVSFKSLLASESLQRMPGLAALLKSLLVWERTPRSAGEWVKAVHALLQATGFLQADNVMRSNAEIRQLNGFRECMASLVAVDAVNEQLSWTEFLSLLSSTCSDTQFTLPAKFQQVAVLPLTSIAGLRFDVVYAVGFDEQALPMAARPAPLLPLPLQRRHHIPGASAVAAWSDSTFLWRELLCTAPVLNVSYAQQREDEQRAASPLLADVAASHIEMARVCESTTPMTPFTDAVDVPLSSSEQVRGGSGIIKHQSACPFRAFATYRLAIKPLGEPEPGIDAADKGSLIHLALEYIWRQLGSQRQLLAQDESQLAALIQAAIAHAWQEGEVGGSDSVRKFEQARMQRVLTEWLEIERQRPEFRVEACERGYRLQLPEHAAVSFPVRLKADRIDRDAEGRKILIDYKTGQKHSVGRWLGERMAEPQLPLYSMAEGLGECDVACFARVRSGDMAFEGLSGEKSGIKGISLYKGNDKEAEDWPALLRLWRARINAVAAEFVAGRSDVAPRDADACKYCGLEALCRIDEISVDRNQAEDEA